MPIDLEQQILEVLSTMRADQRPATIGDFARRFGASSTVVSGCAAQLVSKGLALPSMIDDRGVPRLHGLRPTPSQAKPAATPAE